jgi:putative flippase GtrA
MVNGFIATLCRYGLVGLLVAGLDLSVYWLLLSGQGIWYVYAHTLSRAVGGASGFVLNRGWTFGRRGRTDLIPQLVKFAMTYLFSYTASSCLLYLLVERFRLPAVGAKLFAEGAVFLCNFLLLRQWAFRDRRDVRQSVPPSFPLSHPLAEGGWRRGDR